MTDDLVLTPAPGLRVSWDRTALSDYANGSGEADPAWSLGEPLP